MLKLIIDYFAQIIQKQMYNSPTNIFCFEPGIFNSSLEIKESVLYCKNIEIL